MNINGLVVFLTTVSIVGTIGNLIVAFVYWKKKDRQTSSFFILVLACSDWIVCCVLVPMTIYFESIMFLTQNVFLCKAYYFLTTTIVPSSCLLMTAIAFDRYFCICMVSKNVMNLYRAKVIVVCLILISCLLGVIPSLAATVDISSSSSSLSYESSISFNLTNTNYSIESNTPIYTCTLIVDANSTNSTYYSIVASLLHPFKYCYDLIYALTVIIITTLYILIYKDIYTRRKEKRKRKRQLLFNSWINGGGGGGVVGSIGKKNAFFKSISKKTTNNNNSNNNDNKDTNKIDEINTKKLKVDKNLIKRIDDLNDECNIMETKFLNESTKQEETKHCQQEHQQNQQQQQLLNSSIQSTSSVKRKRSVNVISTKDIRTAFMLFVISFLFICFFSPSLILTYISLLKIPIESNLILTYLYFSNSAINPIIYCFLNPNFRADLIKLFFKRGSIYNTCTKHFNNSFK